MLGSVPKYSLLAHVFGSFRKLNKASIIIIDRGSTGSEGSVDPHFLECGVNQPTLSQFYEEII